MPWAHLFDALEISIKEIESSRLTAESLMETLLRSSAPAVAIGQTRKSYSEGALKSKQTLLSLMERFSHSRTTLERDKIFGLLGLAIDVDKSSFDPDYDSPLETVVRRYANEFIARGQIFDLLCRAGDRKAYPFASWIPSWTGGDYPHTISTWYSGAGFYSASGATITNAFISTDRPEALTISGVFVDSVASTGAVTLENSDMWTFINSLHELLDCMDAYPTGESLEKVKILLPIGNASRPYLERSGDVRKSVQYEAIRESGFNWAEMGSRFTSIQSMVDFLRQNDDVRATWWKYWQTASAFSLRLSNARFHTTSRGFAGLVPPGTQKGDIIAVFHGGGVPFVVRPEAGEDALFRLIGECYVHGLMHGEALKLAGIREQTVHLM
jgi:hypothetical protein